MYEYVYPEVSIDYSPSFARNLAIININNTCHERHELASSDYSWCDSSSRMVAKFSATIDLSESASGGPWNRNLPGVGAGSDLVISRMFSNVQYAL